MFRLLRYFSLAGAATVIIVIAVLMIFFHHLTVEDLINVGERQNEFLTRLIGNDIRSHFGPYLYSINVEDGKTVLTDTRTREISKNLSLLIKGLPVLRVNILNLKGLIIYSTERGKIGIGKRSDAGFIAAREGRAFSRIALLNDGGDRAQSAENLDILSSYLPFRSDDGNVVGVFEIDSDITSLLTDIDEHVLHVFLALLVALGVLYVVLYQVVRRADKTIKSQQIALQSSESEFRDSERKYRNLVETSHDLIWSVDSEGKFTFVNRNAAMHILGYEPDEMIGRSLTYFKTPEQAEKDFKTFARIKETGGASHYETRHRKKDGSFVAMSFNAVVVKDSKGNLMGTMGTAQDISQRKRAEERLSRSEETKRALFAAATDSIFLLDRAGTVLEVNEAGARTLGANVGDMVGRNIFEFMPPEVGDRRRGKLLAMLESKEPVVDEDGRDGSWFETHAQPILDARGEVQRIALFSRNITKRKRAEEHLRQFQKIEAVGQLTGGIAHEFNNILTVVISNLDILDKGDLNESDASTLMQHSTDAAHRGAKLTRQLLAFSRREMLRPETLQTNDLILDEVDFLSPTLGEEITIEAYCAEDLELIEVDRQLLGNAILNLALNARTAMPEGGTLTLETASIDLEEALFDGDGGLPSGRYVTLTVTDTGYGMSPDVLEHAFEPFFTTQGLAEGSGLGLSMVYGFVKQSGGHVTIESEESKGTTVRLFFPVAQGMAEEKEAETVVSR